MSQIQTINQTHQPGIGGYHWSSYNFKVTITNQNWINEFLMLMKVILIELNRCCGGFFIVQESIYFFDKIKVLQPTVSGCLQVNGNKLQEVSKWHGEI